MPVKSFHVGNPPTVDVMTSSIDSAHQPLWIQFLVHIETAFHAKPQVMYSTCSAKPGWNLKYKKNGWALCTLYPEADGFTALIVLSENDRELLYAVKPNLHSLTSELYERTTLFNNTKWLMLPIRDEHVLADAKMLLQIKNDAHTSKRMVR